MKILLYYCNSIAIDMNRRNTSSKQEVLDVIAKSNLALSHDMINERLSIKIDRATIYRILNRYCEDGLLHKVIGDNGKQYFALCKKCDETNCSHSKSHYHFRCEKCGNVECLENDIKINVPEGYVITNTNAMLSGVCKSCI